MIAKILLSISIVAGIAGGVLFSAAGRMDWIEAWILLGLYTSALLFSMVWGVVNTPDLMRERSRMAGNVKPWDKVVNLLYLLMLTVLLLVAGLDAGRFGWSTMPLFMKWIGGLGCGVSAYVIWLTMKENAYLSRWARIQDDRGQKVISSGPYRFIRHPMYAAILLFVVCMTFLLGSWWAFIPAVFVAVLFILRTSLEDKMLHQELEGYCEYASRVKYRLLPFVW